MIFKKHNKDLQRIIFALISFLIILLVWQFISVSEIVNSKLIPPPTKIFKAGMEWIKTGEFYSDFCTSIWRGVIGLIIGSSIGILLGLYTGRSKIGNLFLTPVLNTLKAFPPVAMLPVFITFLGIGDISKITAIAFATIFPLWVNTHLGTSSIPIEFIRSAKLLTKSKAIYFLKVILPASLNSIIAGFRISIAIAFIMLYVSELAGASSGLGYQIASSNLAYRMDKMFAALIVLGLTASVFDTLFNRIIKKLFPWAKINKVI